MFCKECGTENREGARFCVGCGAPLVLPDDGNQEPVPPQPHARRKGLLVTAIVIACILVAGAGYLAYTQVYLPWHEQETTHAVSVSMSFSDSSAGLASKVPVHVVGTNIDSNPVDTVSYVDADGNGMTLREGTYSLTVEASPILEDGTIFTVPSAPVTATIDSSGMTVRPDTSSDATASTATAPAATTDESTSSQDTSFSFEAIDPADVIDDEIRAAVDAAKAGGCDSTEKADSLEQTVTEKRTDAIEERKVEEARGVYDGVLTAYKTAQDSGWSGTTSQIGSLERLIQAKTSISSTKVSASGTIEYAYYDLGGDGVTDLLIGVTNGDVTSLVGAYSYDGSNVHDLGCTESITSVSTYVRVLADGTILKSSGTPDSLYQEEHIYTVSSGSIAQTDDYVRDTARAEASYQHNSQGITKAAFDSFESSIEPATDIDWQGLSDFSA